MNRRRRQAKPVRVPARRWHIPPPLIHGPETLEGGSILQDLPNSLGVTLWQAFRDVMLWATTDAERRGDLFIGGEGSKAEDGATPEDSRVAAGLAVADALVRNPSGADEIDVARACREISEWAQEEGHLNTALAFAQNAALVSRGSASAAFWVASLAGRLNDHARAEGWFRRAVGLARQSRDWRMYSRSFSGLGNLYIRRGNLPAARRLHTRALRAARRGGMKKEQAYAYHDLFVVAVELGNSGEAERFARQALEANGARNDRLHALAHDVAYFWMEKGQFARAVTVFQATLPVLQSSLERMFVLANIARAAGGAGDRDLTREAAGQVESMLELPGHARGTARALLEVAQGLLAVGEYDEAERAARRGLASATDAQENKLRFALEGVLESIVERRGQAGAVEELIRSANAGGVQEGNTFGDRLAADLVRTLETVAGAA